MEVKSCPLCNDATKSFKMIEKDGYLILSCRNCGDYAASEEVIEDNVLSDHPKRHILSGLAKNNKGPKHIFFHSGNIDSLINSSNIPLTPLEKAEHLLLHLYRNTEFPGMGVRLRISHDFFITYSKNPTEFDYLVNFLLNEKYIERNSENGYISLRLTFEGYKKVEELIRNRPKGDQFFVAMSFAPELNDAFDNGIYIAVDEAKYKTIRVDREQHNDKIDDKIISEIRRSSLLVADVTMHRQGVYFEAGFAMGLGIPVIWTCRDTDIDEAHFDTRQYNHIVWSNPQELKEKLLDRINALYPLVVQ